MKRLLPALILAVCLCALPSAGADYTLKGVWVSSVYNLDYPSATGLGADALRAEADAILENAHAWGLNAIFLQVRPAGDALYSSDIFPWSVWLSGVQGQPPDDGFDPLAYFVSRAHGLEIEVHAWINPYRITRSARASREEALAALSPDHPAHAMPQAVVFHTDGCLYFDPGRPESRALIVAGAAELVENYAIDGLHLDDYFYPSGQFDDADTFAQFGGGYDSLADFRRASVTQLIQALGLGVKSHSPYLAFGVSPFGIWANDTQHPEGSATRGDSSYFSHYADTRAWVRDRLVDYIMPQLYWQIGSAEADFDTLLDWWSQTVEDTGVALYIGLAAYRAVEAEADSVWYQADEIIRQFARMEQTDVSGVCLFRYGSLAGQAEMAAFTRDYFAHPPERYRLAYRLRPSVLTLLEPLNALQIPAGGGLPVSLSAPLGSTVRILLDGADTALAQTSDGLYTGLVSAPKRADGPTVRQAVPMALWEQGGLVCAQILPIRAQIVETGEPADITRIAGHDLSDGGRRIEFYTASPVAATAEKTGAAIKLGLTPCRMAVLFEDDFFEAIELTQSGGLAWYTLLLPVERAGWRFTLDWAEDGVSLSIMPPG